MMSDGLCSALRTMCNPIRTRDGRFNYPLVQEPDSASSAAAAKPNRKTASHYAHAAVAEAQCDRKNKKHLLECAFDAFAGSAYKASPNPERHREAHKKNTHTLETANKHTNASKPVATPFTRFAFANECANARRHSRNAIIIPSHRRCRCRWRHHHQRQRQNSQHIVTTSSFGVCACVF